MSVSTSALLRAAWPRNTAKEAARCAGTSVRTAEGWLAGREPGWGIVARMAARNDRLRAELHRALGENDGATALLARRGAGAAADGPVAGAEIPIGPRQGWLRLGSP